MPAFVRGACTLPCLAVVALLAAGCDLVTYRPPVGRDFGSPYAVRAGVPVLVAPGRVLETPALDPARRMYAVVEYEGGCNPHAFTLGSDTRQEDRTIVWLIHDDGGDRCEELVRDTVVVDLGTAYRPGPIALDTPGGDQLLLASLGGG
jgi:hypothetical protein